MNSIKRNTRFDCLKGDDTQRNYSSERFSQTRGDNSRGFSRCGREHRNPECASISNPNLFNLNENSFGNYIHLKSKNETYVTPAQRNQTKYTFVRQVRPKKTTIGDISNVNKFPTLPNVKKNMNEQTALDYSNVKTAESIVKKEVKKPTTFETLPTGWIKLKKENKVLTNPDNNSDDKSEYNNIEPELYNYQCGIACYHTLKNIQSYRDEHIETFGAKSEYYEKSDLLDNYISDSDVEYSDSEDEYGNNLDDDYLDDDY